MTKGESNLFGGIGLVAVLLTCPAGCNRSDDPKGVDAESTVNVSRSVNGKRLDDMLALYRDFKKGVPITLSQVEESLGTPCVTKSVDEGLEMRLYLRRGDKHGLVLFAAQGSGRVADVCIVTPYGASEPAKRP